MQALQSKLKNTPRTPAEQQEYQRVYGELLDVQAQIQRAEANFAMTGQFADYARARERQAAGLDPIGNPVLNAGSNPQNPLLSPLGRDRVANLENSGLGSGVAARTGAGQALTPGEIAMLQEQREGLITQNQQIQQTLRALQPGDQVLADNLKQEQATVLAQLRDIDAKLAGVPQSQNLNPSVPNPNQNPFVIPQANQLPTVTAPGGDIALRMQKVNQAAVLLREAGLPQLAGYATNEVPRLSDPNFVETQLVPGSWAEAGGLPGDKNNPFKQVGAKDIENILAKIDDLTAQVNSLKQTLSDVEVQLKLLTRGSVYAPPADSNEQFDAYDAAVDAVNAAQAVQNAVDTPHENPTPAAEALGTDVPQTQNGQDNLPPIPGAEDIDAPEGSDIGTSENETF